MQRWRRTLLSAVVAMSAAAAVPTVAAAEPAACPRTPFDRSFGDELATRWPGRRFSGAIHDEASGCTLLLHPRLQMTTASVFKLEVLAGVLLRAQDAGRPVTDWEHDRLVPMVTLSANPPTNQLYSYLGGTAGFRALNRRLELGATEPAPSVWGLTHTSAADQLHLVLEVLGDGPGPLTSASRERAWSYAGAVVPSQRWGVGSGAPPDARVGMKNGFAPSHCCGWRLNTAGRVDRPGGAGWAFVLLTDGWPTEDAGRNAVSELGRRINAHLAHLDRPGVR